APTDWMSPPKFEMRFATQTARKMPWRRGEKGDGLLGNLRSDETTASNETRPGRPVQALSGPGRPGSARLRFGAAPNVHTGGHAAKPRPDDIPNGSTPEAARLCGPI